MAQITLTHVSRTDKESKTKRDKQGNPTRYESVSLKATEYGDRFINGFGRADNKDWKAGDKVEVEVKEVESNGKKYLNFEMPERPRGGSDPYAMENRERLLRIEIMLQGTVIPMLKAFSQPVDPMPQPFDDLGPIDESSF